jgi:hypothetical protein
MPQHIGDLSKRRSIEEDLRKLPGAERALDVLVKAGCDRDLLLFLLRSRASSLQAWAHVQQVLAPDPKHLRGLARKFEAVAEALKITTERTIFPPLLALRAKSNQTAKELNQLGAVIRQLAASPLLQRARKQSSYRVIKLLRVALICHHVKRETQKPYFREIADLLSVTDEPIAEDSVRHRARRAVTKLTLNGQHPQILDILLSIKGRTP